VFDVVWRLACGEGGLQGRRKTHRSRSYASDMAAVGSCPLPELFRGHFLCFQPPRAYAYAASSDGLWACCSSGAAWRSRNDGSYCRVAECQVVGVVKRLLACLARDLPE
jgi:hypothetical protein